ncbi:aspartic proteinase CDR1-like [Papaver somniferum]|uniref:aspartic proteinase CDR1-like n=1 Tax=Papaver somniferum TaxID=3469 RepID=UPI000E6F6683|nr:aspartic proteinase CDR1-like [Papaver somniferum]
MGGVITLFILLLTILFHVSLLLNSVIGVNPSGFSMKIFHRDSRELPLYPGDHLTQDERFQRLAQQSKDRARYIRRKMSSLKNSINPDVARLTMTYEDVGGSYVASVGIGTFDGSPAFMRYYLTVDTGSDLTWTQCQGASSYFRQEEPLYPATSSRTCTYEVSYEDDAVTSGILANEKFSVNSDSHALQSFTIVMGCGLNQVNFVSDSRPEVGAGIRGLSGGSNKSFLKQLNLGQFEYCLRPYNDGMDGTPTYLRFGSDTRLSGGVRQAYKTGLYDYGTGHYYLVLEDISVNGSSVGFQRWDFEYEEETRSGGCLIDSGTTMTFMRGSHFDRVVEKVREHFRKFELDPVIPSPLDDMELCFQRRYKRFEFPTITYHFHDADFELKKDEPDTAFWITEDHVCLVFFEHRTIYLMMSCLEQCNKLAKGSYMMLREGHSILLKRIVERTTRNPYKLGLSSQTTEISVPCCYHHSFGT